MAGPFTERGENDARRPTKGQEGGARQRSGALGGAIGRGKKERGDDSVRKGDRTFGGDGGQCGRA